MEDHRIVATWSGGIDSTGVVANLLAAGWDVNAVTLEFGPTQFIRRETEAQERLLPHLRAASLTGGGSFKTSVDDASWLWEFSPDGKEIPTRNRRIIDYLIAKYCLPAGIKNIGMGEYIGCDTWVVRDHVGAADCDARSLTAYIYEQYGIEYRLVTLADFGESRYKSNRLQIGANILGQAMSLTTNCLNPVSVHCGECYKCLERAAAFDTIGLEDGTVYTVDPRKNINYRAYLSQMLGDVTVVPFEEV